MGDPAQKVTYWLALTMVFMIPWEGLYTIAGLGTMTRAIGILIAVAWTIGFLAKLRIRSPDSFHVAMFGFLLWNMCSIIWSIDVDESLQRIKTCFQLGVMVWIVWDLATSMAALRGMMQAYVLGSFVAIGSSFINFIRGIDFDSRFTGAELNANDLAMIIALGLPLAWYSAAGFDDSNRRGLLRVVNYAYIPLGIFAVLLTGSRMGLFSLMPTIVFILATAGYLRLSARIGVLCTLVGALLILLPRVPANIMERLGTARSSIVTADFGGRVEIWREGLAGFAEHPLLGVGAGAFVKVAKRTQGVAHNTFLSVITELGVIGFTLFVFMLARAGIYASVRAKGLPKLWLTIIVIWGMSAFALTCEHRKTTWLFLNFVVIGSSFDEIRKRATVSGQVSACECGSKIGER